MAGQNCQRFFMQTPNDVWNAVSFFVIFFSFAVLVVGIYCGCAMKLYTLGVDAHCTFRSCDLSPQPLVHCAQQLMIARLITIVLHC